MNDPTTPQGPSTSPVEQTAAAAAKETEQFNAVRDLATAINHAANSTTGLTVIKGVVTALGTYTFTATINGDTVSIPEIRYLDSYSPVVGDVVALIKDGSSLFCLGQYNNSTGNGASANGWVTPTLGANFAHVSGDNVQYRKVIDNGDIKIQLKGRCTVTGSPTALWTMPTDMRPASYHSLVIARDVAGGSNTAVLGVNTNGTMFLDGTTTGVKGGVQTEIGGGSASVVERTTNPVTSDNGFLSGGRAATSGSTISMDHNLATNEQMNAHQHHFNHTHDVTVNGLSHQHNLVSVSFPDEVSFHGVEYFL